MRAFAMHTSKYPDMLPQQLELMIKLLLFEDNTSLWALARPLLSLILLAPRSFVAIKEQLIAAQVGLDKQQRLHAAFNKLMEGVKENIMSKNRDVFAQNLTTFMNDVKSFIH